MRGQSRLDSAHTYWELHDGYLDTAFALDLMGTRSSIATVHRVLPCGQSTR